MLDVVYLYHQQRNYSQSKFKAMSTDQITKLAKYVAYQIGGDIMNPHIPKIEEYINNNIEASEAVETHPNIGEEGRSFANGPKMIELIDAVEEYLDEN